MAPDRIRKLLAHANDPACTPAEAAAFRARAERALARVRSIERAYEVTVRPQGYGEWYG